MNRKAITIVIVLAVCLTIEPTPYAISATIVTNSAVPMIAVSTVEAVITSMPEKVAVQLPGPPLPGPPPVQFTLALAGIVTVWKSRRRRPCPTASPARRRTR